MYQLRLQPEDITINIGKDAKVPEPPKGHKWGKVQHDQNVTWLATWKENINNNIKYVFLAAGSSWKGQSDLKKFEKARKLKVRAACTPVGKGREGSRSCAMHLTHAILLIVAQIRISSGEFAKIMRPISTRK